VVVVITPGVDMALVTRNALLYGRRAAVETALGINLGIFFWVMAASLGLAAVVATSAEAFAVIKLALACTWCTSAFKRFGRLTHIDEPTNWPSDLLQVIARRFGKVSSATC
jgi:LysE type translocator